MAAPFQNYSGGVLLADIVKRNNLSTYVSEAIKERSLFIKSGAVVRNSLLDAREGGTRIQVPEFNPVAPTEEIMNGTATWGTSNNGYLTPQKIGTATQIASIVHRGFAYAVDDVALLAAGEDPMLHIRNQLADAINKLNSQRLFSQFGGLFSSGGPLHAHRLILASGTPTGATEANYLTGAAVARARAALGERGDELDILVVHPSVGFYLYQVGLLTFSTSALAAAGSVVWGGGGVGVGARMIGEFAGCRVIIDPLVNTIAPGDSGDQREFRCFLLKGGSVLEGVQQDLRIEADRNILSKQDVLSVDYHGAYHVMGTKWTSASDNPTNAQLSDNNNWTATYDIDLIPMVEVIVNSPLDTSVI
jgi:hypothetical protein